MWVKCVVVVPGLRSTDMLASNWTAWKSFQSRTSKKRVKELVIDRREYKKVTIKEEEEKELAALFLGWNPWREQHIQETKRLFIGFSVCRSGHSHFPPLLDHFFPFPLLPLTTHSYGEQHLGCVTRNLEPAAAAAWPLPFLFTWICFSLPDGRCVPCLPVTIAFGAWHFEEEVPANEHGIVKLVKGKRREEKENKVRRRRRRKNNASAFPNELHTGVKRKNVSAGRSLSASRPFPQSLVRRR